MQAIYEWQFVGRKRVAGEKCWPDEDRIDGVPTHILCGELGGSLPEMEATVDVLLAKEILKSPMGSHNPYGAWHLPDGRILKVVQTIIDEPQYGSLVIIGVRYFTEVLVDGHLAVGGRSLDSRPLRLTPRGVELAEAIRGAVQGGRGVRGAPATPNDVDVAADESVRGVSTVTSTLRLYTISDAWRRLRESGFVSLSYEAFKKWRANARKHDPSSEVRRRVLATYIEETQAFDAARFDEVCEWVRERVTAEARRSRSPVTEAGRILAQDERW